MNPTEAPPNQGLRTHRDRNSSRWVRMSDRIAKQVITIGGIGTIFVVLLVVFVLIGNVLPLFQANQISPVASFSIGEIATAKTDVQKPSDVVPLGVGVDEYGELAWVVRSNSVVDIYMVSTGKLLHSYRPAEAPGNAEAPSLPRATACSIADNDASLMLGYEDGSVRAITLQFQQQFIKNTDLGTLVFDRGVAVDQEIVYRQMPSGLVRKLSVESVRFYDPIPTLDKAIVAIDWKTPQVVSSFDESMTWRWAASDGRSVVLGLANNQVNTFSGAVTQEITRWRSEASVDDRTIRSVMIASRGDSVSTLNDAGRVLFWEGQAGEKLVNTKSHLSLAGTESKVTVATPLLGRTTMVVGAESGHIEAVAMSAVGQEQELLSIHRFAGNSGRVADLVSSPESRMVAASFDNGVHAMYYVPTNQKLLSWSMDDVVNRDTSKSKRLFFSANAKMIGCWDADGIDLWSIEIPYPESSIAGFFYPIWYEGYDSPRHVWQSSTGNVEGEYKFGFMPLIFGTLKATFYSMLIGAPIALMAAIFGSEFMNSRWRTRVKPVIELMASVPSVVLGFIGALVLAPFLRDNLMACLLCVPMVLLLFLLGANLWLLLPNTVSIRAARLRLPILMTLIPIGICIAFLASGPIEGWLFEGSIAQWLAGQVGSAWAGWFCLGLLPCALLTAWLVGGPVSPWLQRKASARTPLAFGLFNIVFFIGCVVFVLALSSLIGLTLAATGLDARGPLLGPYQERNAILVGCILGFAIIPLIYTISEDALQSVPQHLRSASLGCGATTWQTTIRVVVPTAMSGLFSAMMIGFGRAVGETMVVLMAAGNTPLMDVNPMNGYRTLSATLATELPEAARGSTHYHSLFLAALLLFCFTLVANTIAELVRIRFRKRAFQL